MKIHSDSLTEDLLIAALRGEDGQEHVAVLFGTRDGTSVRVDRFQVVPNRHEDPEHYFRVLDSDVTVPGDREIVGVAHTHPLKGKPSRADMDDLKPGDVGILVRHDPDRVTYYTWNGIYPMSLNEVPVTPETEQDFTVFYMNGTKYRVSLSWLMSNWECMYGSGCPGCLGNTDTTTHGDVACCHSGVYMHDEEERARVDALAKELTAEDVGQARLDLIRTRGWDVERSTNPKAYNVRTRIVNGGCIFALRDSDGLGKTGCAFHHLGTRTGREHVDVMPDTCWQVPLGKRDTFDEEERLPVVDLIAWDKRYFYTEERDVEDYGALGWWCVNAPDAYRSDTMLYRSMERELRRLVGNDVYEYIAKIIEARIAAQVPVTPMPGQVRNGGRPLIPLFVSALKENS